MFALNSWSRALMAVITLLRFSLASQAATGRHPFQPARGLTVKQLQTLAKQQGISIARTKADFLTLLDAADQRQATVLRQVAAVQAMGSEQVPS